MEKVRPEKTAKLHGVNQGSEPKVPYQALAIRTKNKKVKVIPFLVLAQRARSHKTLPAESGH
jgi:hypothetical protein